MDPTIVAAALQSIDDEGVEAKQENGDSDDDAHHSPCDCSIAHAPLKQMLRNRGVVHRLALVVQSAVRAARRARDGTRSRSCYAVGGGGVGVGCCCDVEL